MRKSRYNNTRAASWGGGRLRFRSSINYAEDEGEDEDAIVGRGQQQEDEGEEGGATAAGRRGSADTTNTHREARQQQRRTIHQRSVKQLFKRLPLNQKARPLRQVGKNGTAVVHHTTRHHTTRHPTNREHPNRTACIGDTARFNATRAQLSLFSPTFSPTTLLGGRSARDFFKAQKKPGHNNYTTDNPSIEEIFRVLQRLEEDTKVETKRRRLKAGQIARPPWRRGPRPNAASREKAPEDIESPEKRSCIVSLEKVGMPLGMVGMTLGKIGTTTTADALGLPTTAGAMTTTTTATTPTNHSPVSSTSGLFARIIKTEEEDWTEQAQQPWLGGEGGAAGAAVGRNAPSYRPSGKAFDAYVSVKGAVVVGRRTPPCRPSVEVFDAAAVREAAAAAAAVAMPPPPSRPPAKVSDAFAVKQQPSCEGSSRLAWQRPPLPRTIETKSRRIASGSPCAGRVAHHRRAGGAPKAERKRKDGLRKGGAPKAKGGNDNLQEASGSVGALFVKGAPVSVAPVAVDVCGGGCERHCGGRCECCRSDALSDLSVKQGSMPPPPPPPRGKLVAVPASSIESLRTESSSLAEASLAESPQTSGQMGLASGNFLIL